MVDVANSERAIPETKGPRLEPFSPKNARIRFKRLISDPEADESHGFVFEVTVGRQSFALKVFKFFNEEDARDVLMDDEIERVSIETVYHHIDPFYAECRAYGRLIRRNVNGKIAAACHGYCEIPAEREKELAQRFDVEDWNRPPEHEKLPIRKRPPLRAIVKQLLPDGDPLSQKLADKMLRDLKAIRRVSVYPRDIQERNYKSGLLVDMSVAIVRPHCVLMLAPKETGDLLLQEDLDNFQEMVDDAGVVLSRRATPLHEYTSRLRSYN